MVAELLCTTMVMERPSRMPRSGDSFTRVIQSRKTACPASGCKARPRMSMPSKSSPKENTASPTACQRGLQAAKSRRKPRNSTGYTSVWTSKAMSCAVMVVPMLMP